MRQLIVFNHITLDGYFVGEKGDSNWAHQHNEDPEYNEWQKGNASGQSEFLFGRVTYQLMASYWPTPMAKEQNPEFAAAMNNSPKVVFSRILDKADWNNTRLVKSDLIQEVKKMKSAPGPNILIFGSGDLIAQLASADLIDIYMMVLNPVVLGKGRSMFESLKSQKEMHLQNSRTFRNGKVLLNYTRI